MLYQFIGSDESKLELYENKVVLHHAKLLPFESPKVTEIMLSSITAIEVRKKSLLTSGYISILFSGGRPDDNVVFFKGNKKHEEALFVKSRIESLINSKR